MLTTTQRSTLLFAWLSLLITCSAWAAEPSKAMQTKSVQAMGDCQAPDAGIQKSLDGLIDGYNQHKVDRVEPYVDKDVAVTRVDKKGKIKHVDKKDGYLKHLVESWKALKDPIWHNSTPCQADTKVHGLTKVVVYYDFEWTNPATNKREPADPAVAVLYFGGGDKLMDATFVLRKPD